MASSSLAYGRSPKATRDTKLVLEEAGPRYGVALKKVQVHPDLTVHCPVRAVAFSVEMRGVNHFRQGALVSGLKLQNSHLPPVVVEREVYRECA